MTAFHLEDFVNERTLTPYRAERREDYAIKAMRFMRKSFPQCSGSDDETLLRVIRLAYGNARRRGIRTERDHLKFLIPVVHWGSYFETDPLYFTALHEIGWVGADGESVHAPYFPRLLDQIDQLHRATVQDFADPDRFQQVLGRLQQAGNLTEATATAILEQAWPAHARADGSFPNGRFLRFTFGIARTLELSAPDAMLYSLIARVLGCRFGQDPLYPWAAKAVSAGDRQTAAMLTDGFMDFWHYRTHGKENRHAL